MSCFCLLTSIVFYQRSAVKSNWISLVINHFSSTFSIFSLSFTILTILHLAVYLFALILLSLIELLQCGDEFFCKFEVFDHYSIISVIFKICFYVLIFLFYETKFLAPLYAYSVLFSPGHYECYFVVCLAIHCSL